MHGEGELLGGLHMGEWRRWEGHAGEGAAQEGHMRLRGLPQSAPKKGPPGRGALEKEGTPAAADGTLWQKK